MELEHYSHQTAELVLVLVLEDSVYMASGGVAKRCSFFARHCFAAARQLVSARRNIGNLLRLAHLSCVLPDLARLTALEWISLEAMQKIPAFVRWFERAGLVCV